MSAAALLVASPLLTACGSAPHPGSAAVVDGERITVSQLQTKVEDVRDAQRRSEQSAQLIQATGDLSRITLNNMIFSRVLNRAATDAGVTVSRGDLQRKQVVAELSQGGPEQLRVMLLQQHAVGPGGVGAAIRNDVVMDKLAEALGVDWTTPEGLQKIVAALGEASAKMTIDVSPRFGAWDDTMVQLENVEEPWLRSTLDAGEPSR